MPAVAASELIDAIRYLPPRAAWLKTGVSWEEYEEVLEYLDEHEPFKTRVTYDRGAMEIFRPPAYKAEASDFIAALAHLSPGASLLADDVSWAVYEQLLDELGDGYAVRVFYNQGRLIVMPPLVYAHEKPKDIIHSLVIVLRDELDVDVEFAGSITLKNEAAAQGAEPDTCFYVQNAARVAGRRDFPLRAAPPPDVAVEIDHTSLSADKFEIYAGLGVPEIWRWHRNGLEFHRLAGQPYERTPVSVAFPFLPAAVLAEFVRLGRRESERAAAKAFRHWLREHLPATNPPK